MIDRLRTELLARYDFIERGKGAKSSDIDLLVSGGNGGRSARGGERGGKSGLGERKAEILWVAAGMVRVLSK